MHIPMQQILSRVGDKEALPSEQAVQLPEQAGGQDVPEQDLVFSLDLVMAASTNSVDVPNKVTSDTAVPMMPPFVSGQKSPEMQIDAPRESIHIQTETETGVPWSAAATNTDMPGTLSEVTPIVAPSERMSGQVETAHVQARNADGEPEFWLPSAPTLDTKTDTQDAKANVISQANSHIAFSNGQPASNEALEQETLRTTKEPDDRLPAQFPAEVSGKNAPALSQPLQASSAQASRIDVPNQPQPGAAKMNAEHSDKKGEPLQGQTQGGATQFGDRSTSAANVAPTQPGAVPSFAQGSANASTRHETEPSRRTRGALKGEVEPASIKAQITDARSSSSPEGLTVANQGSSMLPVRPDAYVFSEIPVSDIETSKQFEAALFEPRAPDQSGMRPGAEMRAAEVPRSIAAQIIGQARIVPDKPVEITLNPEELGKLRMTFAPDAQSMSVSLTFERPETLELMRRNIEQLAQEFRTLGYEDVSFTFEQGDTSTSGDGSPDQEQRTDIYSSQPAATAEPSSQPSGHTHLTPALAALSGVDIRI
ncbi:flagellar hook-length control protein FliK [Aliiroseovarius marinus]|uniref:flagellar hook-length control protein FliK n=1 Tax=Aliiroseovarius marinus TaxID=2500159 RepID=UPI003D7EBC9A